jgi:N-hydroxyarylamine O-acetyltransferase
MPVFDLERYLARIGWEGSREPTAATLAGVLRAHMTAIPFENLDVLLGRGVSVELDRIDEKLLGARRGGYCFEHGTLLHAGLCRLGFEPAIHTARVIMQRARAEAPLTHMCLTVRVDGQTLVLDPGFGGLAPLVPVPVGRDEDRRHGDLGHRMVRQDGEWVLEAEVNGQPMSLWCSSLEPVPHIDIVMGNHFVATAPESPFIANLMLRAIAPAGRVSVLNRELTLRGAGGEVKQLIPSRTALREILATHFGFDLPEVERLRVPAVPEWG